ncbi:MAG: VTT domain-containing protein [Alphaproteobacteria bacterium]|nr:VTT domain-containing protein [Alphaproteobacteria bacterium]
MKFIDSVLKKSGHPAYSWVVFLMTVCESVFLFVPPEVFMTPAIIADRRRVMPITIAAILGSFVGGILAYIIGLWLFDSVGMWIINNFASAEKFQIAQDMFIQHGALIIMLSAMTPIPYKLMAICAGFLSFPIFIFIGVSAVFRSARFAIVGFLLWRFQGMANTIVKKYFWYLVAGAIIFAGAGVGMLFMFQ